MKTENFDDAIRNKLDDINQKYDEENIDKVYNYVSDRMQLPFWKSYGRTILYTSGVAIIGFLTVLNFTQFYENNQLHKKLNSLQSRIDKVEQHNSIFVAKIKSNEKSGVIIMSTNTNNFGSLITTKTNNLVESIATISDKSDGKDSYYFNANNSLIDSEKNKLSSNSNTGVPNSNNLAQLDNADNYITNVPDSSIIWKSYFALNTTNDSLNNSNPENSNSISIRSDSSTGVDNQLKSKQKSSHKSSFSNWVPNLSNPFAATTTETYSNHMSLKNLRFRGGIGGEEANRQFGLGLVGEILLSARWGFSAGLKFLAINNEKYNDDRDFHHKKGMHFNTVYNMDAFDTACTNIGINTILFQVPIAITYQLPLKNNFSVIAALGTDIDIHSKQIVDYDHDEILNQNQLKKFTTNYPVTAFNNIVISAGLQKRWKGFVFQANPFISPQFKTVIYKKEDVYAGIRFNILFSSER